MCMDVIAGEWYGAGKNLSQEWHMVVGVGKYYG